MEWIDGGVTAAKGFLAGHTAAGIKYENRDDMAIIFSETACDLAGTFTQNVVQAAPVLWDKAMVQAGRKVQAVVVNAGIANACTGEEGFSYCRQTAEAAAEAYGIDAGSVCVASTGVIGMQLPIDRIRAGVAQMKATLSESREAAHSAAKAIMTTDTVPKEAAVTIKLGDTVVTIGGMTKGSGMIHPNMCTMLCFLTTDAVIAPELLQEALSQTVKDTYNMISVDGDTSTNDTCLLLANGNAGNAPITKEDGSFALFTQALYEVNRKLARMMAKDGEGATALLEVIVEQAWSEEDARCLAKSVTASSLVKAMIYGHDANSGRVLCALGYAGVEFDPRKVDVIAKSRAGETALMRNGQYADYSEEKATKILSEDEVTIVCVMHEGEASATAWGCDLTYDYVKINADYRS